MSGCGGGLSEAGLLGGGLLGGGLMMTAPPEGGSGDGVGAVVGGGRNAAAWLGSPRLEEISGRKNASMASAEQGWFGPQASAGVVFSHPNSRAMAPARARRTPPTFIPERIILSGKTRSG